LGDELGWACVNRLTVQEMLRGKLSSERKASKCQALRGLQPF
jgi:hypothetical protein